MKSARLVPLLVVLFAYISLCSAHYHAQPNAKDLITGVKLSRGLVEKRQVGRQQIRIIKIFDASVNNLNPSTKTMIMDEVVPNLVSFLTSALKVDRVQAPILLDRNCAGRSFFPRSNGNKDCVSTCEVTRCGEVIVPNDHLKQCIQCNDQGSNSCTQTIASGSGISGADVVLYVSAIETNCPGAASAGGSQTVAFATACQMEADLDRPIAGNINFCPMGVEGNAAEYIQELAKHETTHALAFASSLFAYWRDANGTPRTSRDQNGNPEVFDSSNGFYQPSQSTIMFNHVYNDWVTLNGVIQHTVNLMVTPAVLREARAHFGCNSLVGVELENQGGTGTALSHWEKRILGNEAMTGELTFNPVFSRITLAAYEDSGWYDVDYAMAEELVWGKGAGCRFASGSCLEWINSQSSLNQLPIPYCTEVTYGCTVDYQAVAQCNLVTFAAVLDSNYRFFQNPAQGGKTQIADYCPFENTFTVLGTDGTVRGTECSMTANQPPNNPLLQSYGPQSRCIRHGTRDWTNSLFTGFKVGSGCYQYSCSPETGVSISVGSRTFQCACEGEEIRFEFSEGFTFYTGSFACPACSQLCYDNLSSCPSPAPSSCFGRITNTGPTVVRGGAAAHHATVVMTIVSAALAVVG